MHSQVSKQSSVKNRTRHENRGFSERSMEPMQPPASGRAKVGVKNRTYLSIWNKHIRLLRSAEHIFYTAKHIIFGRITKPNKPRSSRDRIILLNKLKDVRHPEIALKIFYRAEERGYRHHYPTYSAMIDKLGRAGKFQTVKTLLDRIKHEDIECNETLFNAIIQHYGKLCMMEEAIDLFHAIPQFNCRCTIESFNVLLEVLVDGDRLFQVRELFESVHKMGITLNVVSFNILIKAECNLNRLAIARQLFDKMQQRGITPTIVTYNTLIGFFCEKGLMTEAMETVKEMEKMYCRHK